MGKIIDLWIACVGRVNSESEMTSIRNLVNLESINFPYFELVTFKVNDCRGDLKGFRVLTILKNCSEELIYLKIVIRRNSRCTTK